MAEQELQIQIDEETAKGRYTNLAVVSHTENEFIFDFVFIHPPQGKVVSRVITSPGHAKRIIKALAENLALYEKNIGPIPEPKSPHPPVIGIQLSNN